MRIGCIFLIILLFLVNLTGCKQSNNTEAPSVKEPIKEELTGTITAAGSTSLQPLAVQAAAEFMSKHSNVSIIVEGGGSKTGIKRVGSGSIEIGNSDISIFEQMDTKKARGFIDNKVAAIAFVIVVNENVMIDSLTGQQIQDVFSGKTTNWRDLGGIDEPIRIINRPKSSGTRTIFEKTLLKGTDANESIGSIQDSNAAVEQTIHTLPGSIGYLAMPYIVGKEQRALKIVKLDGATATVDNIVTGKYPFWAYQYMVTKGEASGIVKDYIDYISGVEFEKKVEEMGYIPMTKLHQ